MPLLDSDFDQKFVQVKQEGTIAQALEALHARGGEDDWHFFVERPGNKFGVLKVAQLKEYLVQLGPTLFELTFAQLGSRVPDGRVAQQEKIGIGTAEKWALEDAQGVLVVVRGDKIAGRLYMAVERGADPFPASTMGQLYGDYLDAHRDARSRWRPAEVVPPTCPHCGRQGFFRYRVEDEAFYCDNCGKIVSEGV